MKTKSLSLLLIAFMAIILVACGGSGMAAVAVEPAAEAIQESQVVQSEPRREVSNFSDEQAEAPIREPDTPTPVEVVMEPTVEPTAEPTTTLAPVPTETPVPAVPYGDAEWVDEDFVPPPPDAPVAHIRVTCGVIVQDLFIEDEAPHLPLVDMGCPEEYFYQLLIEVVELSGPMIAAEFTVLYNGELTSLSSWRPFEIDFFPPKDTANVIVQAYYRVGYFQGALVTLYCPTANWPAVQEPWEVAGILYFRNLNDEMYFPAGSIGCASGHDMRAIAQSMDGLIKITTSHNVQILNPTVTEEYLNLAVISTADTEAVLLFTRSP